LEERSVIGCRWSEMPRKYCHPTTAWRRLKRHSKGCLKGDTGWERKVKGTKVHALATKEGIPLRLLLSGGNAHTIQESEEVGSI